MTTTSSRPIGGTDIRKFDIYLGGRRNLGGMGADPPPPQKKNRRNRSKTCSIERPSIFSDIPDLFPFYSQNKNAMCSLFLEKS